MTTSLKKLLLVSITLLMGLCSGAVMAQTYTNYDFSATYPNFSEGPTLILGGSISGNLNWNTYVVTVTGGSFGTGTGEIQYMQPPSPGFQSDVGFKFGTAGTYFSFVNDGFGNVASYHGTVVFPDVPTMSVNSEPGAIFGPSAVAPEMNASLIPQVGLLLGCLFFLMGRKKENTLVMNAA